MHGRHQKLGVSSGRHGKQVAGSWLDGRFVPLVGEVDAELLKAVNGKIFEAKDVEQPNVPIRVVGVRVVHSAPAVGRSLDVQGGVEPVNLSARWGVEQCTSQSMQRAGCVQAAAQGAHAHEAPTS